MAQKINITVGRTAKGPKVLYIGYDAGKAKEVYTAAVNGADPDVDHVSVFFRPSPDRRHDVVSAELVNKSEPVQDARANLEQPAQSEVPAAPAEAPVVKPKASRKAK